MDFKEFKLKHLKKEVIEHSNNRNNKKPLATIKVVVYNHKKYIKDCLESILRQKTDFDFEILIAEDDSNDGTREVCIEYANKYPNKIRLLLNCRENNISIKGKPSGLFNSVYANYSAKGKYLTTVEADDYWTDDFSLQKRVDFLEKNTDYVACFHHTNVEKDEKITESIFNYNEDKTINSENFLKLLFPTISLIYRNGLIDLYDDAMTKIVCGDLILRGKLSLHGKAKFLNNISPAIYRHHKGGVFSLIKLKNKVKLSVDGLEYLLEDTKETPNKKLKQGISFLYLSYFYSLLIRDRELNIKYLVKSYKIGKSVNYSLAEILRDYKKLKN